ncbi:unnamed protein product [Prunus armeniaca]
MKGVLAMEPSSYAGNEDPRTRFKHQSLMQGEIWCFSLDLNQCKPENRIGNYQFGLIRFLSCFFKNRIGPDQMNSTGFDLGVSCELDRAHP